MTDQLLETFADGILTLTLNRPEARNALTGDMLDALMRRRDVPHLIQTCAASS